MYTKKVSIKILLRTTCVSAYLSAGALGSLEAHAQSVFMDEIVITAQKKEQNLQDVGVAVTAYTGDQLRALGFTDSIDLIAQTPGLEASGFGGGAITSFIIRGIGQNDFTPNQEAPVALYIDGAYQSSNITNLFSLFDLERVEVLRGPQGTLYGRNATGGLVHYITAKPSQDSFGGYLDATVGAQGRVKVEGAVGGALSDTVSGRVAFNMQRDNGLLENDANKNTMRQKNFAGRAQLLFEPTADFSVLLKAQYGEENGAPGGYSSELPAGSATDFFGNVGDAADGDPYTISNDFESFARTNVLDLSANVTAAIGNGVELTSITNFQDITGNYGEDTDASPVSAYNYVQDVKLKQISQELRFAFEGDKHNTVIGVYFLNIDGDFLVQQSGDVFFGAAVFDIVAVQKTQTFAIFGQTEYDLSDDLVLTIGARYNYDKKDYTLLAPDFGFADYNGGIKDGEWAGKLQLDYQASDDVLVYAGVNRGIKSGGFNLPLTPVDPNVLKYGGEVLTSYEGGVKLSLGNNTRLNISTFYYDYDNYQAFNIDPFFNALIFNAKAKMHGGEAELTTSPIEGLDVLLGMAYVETKITDLPIGTFAGGTAKAALAPEFSFNGLVRYAWPAFGGEASVQGDFSWKDDHTFNLVLSDPVIEGSYGVVNAKLGYTSGNKVWSVSVFANNLTNTRYRKFAVDGTAFFGSFENIMGDKRWFGGNVRFYF